MKAKIISDTFIKGRAVSAGEVVEVDEATYRALEIVGRAEKCKEQSKQNLPPAGKGTSPQPPNPQAKL